MPWATLWMRGWLGEGKNTEEENGRQSVRGCMGGGGGGREKAGRRVFGREIKERWSMNFLDLLILNFFPSILFDFFDWDFGGDKEIRIRSAKCF